MARWGKIIYDETMAGLPPIYDPTRAAKPPMYAERVTGTASMSLTFFGYDYRSTSGSANIGTLAAASLAAAVSACRAASATTTAPTEYWQERTAFLTPGSGSCSVQTRYTAGAFPMRWVTEFGTVGPTGNYVETAEVPLDSPGAIARTIADGTFGDSEWNGWGGSLRYGLLTTLPTTGAAVVDACTLTLAEADLSAVPRLAGPPPAWDDLPSWSVPLLLPDTWFTDMFATDLAYSATGRYSVLTWLCFCWDATTITPTPPTATSYWTAEGLARIGNGMFSAKAY